ncbi:hypothetical protein [Peribacillus frigoritolerans]|uniref:Uncharacterized protein n=1 Tax=Peribacillus frigoritolerans TaxID=450367 RepID=A0AAJ1VCN8_9BACI|nr:hypothetical protein [Peribacillus frigoritolerans]MDM5285657.1 hypothetical protein [Peribacillus frigoritolerans]
MKTQPKEWKLYKEYLEEHGRAGKQMKKYQDAVPKAFEDKVAAEHAYNSLFERELCGEDVQKEKEEARKNIDEARRKHSEAVAELSRAQQVLSSRKKSIDIKDLVMDWNANYVPGIKKEEVNPILERMEATLANYYSDLIAIMEIQEAYSPLHGKISELEYARTDGIRNEPTIAAHAIISIPRDVPKPSNADLYHVQTHKQLPTHLLKHRKEVK